jgi:hypothetical protein
MSRCAARLWVGTQREFAVLSPHADGIGPADH